MKKCLLIIQQAANAPKILIFIIFPLFVAFSARATGEKFVLWESFEEILTPGLPTGWTVVNQNMDDKQWETIKYGGLPLRHQCARYNGNPLLPASDWMFSPSVSLDAGTDYTLSFLCKVSGASVQKLRIFIGNSPDPSAMTTQLYDDNNITNTTLQEITISFSVPASGIFYFGFYCYSDPNQKQFFLDDISVSCVSSELNLKFVLTKKLLDPSTIPAYSATEAILGYTIIENVSSGSLVVNTSFNVGSLESEYELSYIVIAPGGDTLQNIISAEPEPFSSSRTFEQVDPGKAKGRYEDIQKSFIFTQTGTYSIRVVYLSSRKSSSYNAWLGKLISDPVTFIIQ